jgi:hypothetical protein
MLLVFESDQASRPHIDRSCRTDMTGASTQGLDARVFRGNYGLVLAGWSYGKVFGTRYLE